MSFCIKKYLVFSLRKSNNTKYYRTNNNRKGAVTNVLSQLPFSAQILFKNSFLKNKPKFHKNLKNNE